MLRAHVLDIKGPEAPSSRLLRAVVPWTQRRSFRGLSVYACDVGQGDWGDRRACLMAQAQQAMWGQAGRAPLVEGVRSQAPQQAPPAWRRPFWMRQQARARSQGVVFDWPSDTLSWKKDTRWRPCPTAPRYHTCPFFDWRPRLVPPLVPRLCYAQASRAHLSGAGFPPSPCTPRRRRRLRSRG